MKGRYLIYVVIICIFSVLGCAGTEIIRTVQDDNVFYSSSKPKINIKINPDFKFNKETDQQSSGFSSGYGEKSSTQDISKYLFIDSSGKPRAIEIVIIEMVSPKWSFKPNIFAVKNPYSSGRVKMSGKDYQYCVYSVRTTANDSLLIKGTGRLVGARANCILIMNYIEQVTGEWSNFNMLTPDQQKTLNEFIEDSQKDIQILEN